MASTVSVPAGTNFTLGGGEQLLFLACADPKSVEERLHELYDWRVDQAKTPARGAVAASVATASALLISLLKHEVKVHWYYPVVVAVALLLITTYGVAAHFRVARLHREYLVAIALLRLIVPPL